MSRTRSRRSEPSPRFTPEFRLAWAFRRAAGDLALAYHRGEKSQNLSLAEVCELLLSLAEKVETGPVPESFAAAPPVL